MNKEDLLEFYYGFKEFRSEQEKIIDSVIQGFDTIGLLPTGYGKSITFIIPALMMEGLTIVVTPLIALMNDQTINLKKRGIKAEYINSSLNNYEIDNIYNKIKLNKVKILFVSGERLSNKKFLSVINTVDISFVVSDEAHTLLWSEDFREKLKDVGVFIKNLKARPKILALTATATSTTVTKITSMLDLKNPTIIKANPDRENIYYDIRKSDNKIKDLVHILSKFNDQKCLIYTLTINHTKYVYDYLKNLGYNVGYYYGPQDSTLKEYYQNAFSTGLVNVMVATLAFGMGIDIPDIRLVILYDMPSSIEDYVQEIGRASRDGKNAYSVLLYNKSDFESNSYFIEQIDELDKTEEEKRRIKNEKYNKLDKMISLCLTHNCLHYEVVKYFGFNNKKKCLMCSNCNKKTLI